MDFQNRVKTFEEVLMVDPLDEVNSRGSVKKIASQYDFDGSVYSKKVTSQYMCAENLSRKLPKPPRIVFMPTDSMMRKMIDANIKYSSTDTIARFLLRFGCVENIQKHQKSRK